MSLFISADYLQGHRHKKEKIVLLLSHSTQRDSVAYRELFKILVKIISSGQEITIAETLRNAFAGVYRQGCSVKVYQAPVVLFLYFSTD